MIQVITLSGSPGVTHVPFNKNKTTHWFLPHLSPQNALCLCTETENIKICSSSQHNIHYWRKMFTEWRNCKCLDVVTDTCTVYNPNMGWWFQKIYILYHRWFFEIPRAMRLTFELEIHGGMSFKAVYNDSEHYVMSKGLLRLSHFLFVFYWTVKTHYCNVPICLRYIAMSSHKMRTLKVQLL